MTSVFKQDLKRWYGRRETAKERLLRPGQLWYIYHLRRAGETRGIIRWYHMRRMHRLSLKTGISISLGACIGAGLYVPHFGDIVVKEGCRIGKNITLGAGCVIGDATTVGDCVWIGADSMLSGGITIGSDVVIAPGALVHFDVPDHSIVLGNPGVIHSKENAAEGYITRRI